MFNSRIFRIWFFGMLCLWAWLFWNFNSLEFLAEHWYYPAVMVLGAFVAGLTPEGGGAVAFPVLSVFFQIDRVLARDFSLMIQSVGMTSASVNRKLGGPKLSEQRVGFWSRSKPSSTTHRDCPAVQEKVTVS